MQRLAHPLGAVLVGAAQQPRQRARGLMAPAFGLEQSPQPSEGLAQLRGQFRGHLRSWHVTSEEVAGSTTGWPGTLRP